MKKCQELPKWRRKHGKALENETAIQPRKITLNAMPNRHIQKRAEKIIKATNGKLSNFDHFKLMRWAVAYALDGLPIEKAATEMLREIRNRNNIPIFPND